MRKLLILASFCLIASLPLLLLTGCGRAGNGDPEDTRNRIALSAPSGLWVSNGTIDGLGVLGWNHPPARSFGFIVEINGQEQESAQTTLSLTHLDAGTHTARVRAIGYDGLADRVYTDSAFSNPFVFHIQYGAQAVNVGFNNGILEWEHSQIGSYRASVSVLDQDGTRVGTWSASGTSVLASSLFAIVDATAEGSLSVRVQAIPIYSFANTIVRNGPLSNSIYVYQQRLDAPTLSRNGRDLEWQAGSFSSNHFRFSVNGIVGNSILSTNYVDITSVGLALLQEGTNSITITNMPSNSHHHAVLSTGPEGEYVVTRMSVSSNSIEINFERETLPTPENLRVSGDYVEWDPVEGVQWFVIRLLHESGASALWRSASGTSFNVSDVYGTTWSANGVPFILEGTVYVSIFATTHTGPSGITHASSEITYSNGTLHVLNSSSLSESVTWIKL